MYWATSASRCSLLLSCCYSIRVTSSKYSLQLVHPHSNGSTTKSGATPRTIPGSRFRQDFILKFLRESKGSSRAVEVRLYVPRRFYGRKPVASRTWEARPDLVSTAKEIAKYVSQ
jgi:hypothetical protein